MWADAIIPITPSVQTGTDGQGQPTYAPKPGYSVTTTNDVLAATPAAATYQVAPPLNNVWAGDDPNNPTFTVELCFPDEATAQSILAAFWTIP